MIDILSESSMTQESCEGSFSGQQLCAKGEIVSDGCELP